MVFDGSLNVERLISHRYALNSINEGIDRALHPDEESLVTEATWRDQCDHSWDIRAEMRTDESGPPLTLYPPSLYCLTTARFKRRCLHIFFKERAPGDKSISPAWKGARSAASPGRPLAWMTSRMRCCCR